MIIALHAKIECMNLSFKIIKDSIKQTGMLESSLSTEDCAIFTAPDKTFKYASVFIYNTKPVEYLALYWADQDFTINVS